MRVLVAHNYYQQAGGEDGVFHDETALLEEHGHDVLRYAVRNDEIEGASRFGKLAVAAGSVWNRKAYRRMRSTIRDHNSEVVHVHNTLPLLSPAIYHAAHAEGAAVVQTLHNFRILCAGALLYRDGRVCEDCIGKRFSLHGIRHKCYRESASASAAVATSTAFHWIARTWTQTVDRYISMTEFGKSRFVAGGLPADRIVVKPHFVRNAPGRGVGDGDYFLFVGRLTADKGVHTLLDAWRRQTSGKRLLIAGDGPAMAALTDETRGMEGVELLGRQPADQVLDLMRGASAVVVPSLWYETFGRVITESFACGTPVIVSDIGAIAELVEHGVNGFRFAPGDAVHLAETMNWFAANPDGVQAMRDAAFVEYEGRYTPDKNYDQLLSVYESAIANYRESRPADSH